MSTDTELIIVCQFEGYEYPAEAVYLTCILLTVSTCEIRDDNLTDYRVFEFFILVFYGKEQIEEKL